MILTIWVGQAGINIAEKFWRYVCSSLDISMEGRSLELTDMSFQETSSEIDKKKFLHITDHFKHAEMEDARLSFFYKTDDKTKYVPRALFLDTELDPATFYMNKYKKLFPKENFLIIPYGSASNFARAERLSKNLLIEFFDRIEKLRHMGAIGVLEGIIIVHGIGGGAGSGLFAETIKNLKDRYSRVPILTFSIFPSKNISANVIEPYNSIYSIMALQKYADAVIVIDNKKLIELVQTYYEISAPGYEEINLLVSRFIFSLMIQFALPGSKTRIQFNKIFTNLVPFSYSKYLICEIAPVAFDAFSRNKIEEIMDQLTSSEVFMADCGDFNTGKYISSMFLFMGQLGPSVNSLLAEQKKKRMKFIPWMETGTLIGITPRKGLVLDGQLLNRQGVALVNHTALAKVFQRIKRDFDLMYEKKAYIHWFQKENFEALDVIENGIQNVDRIIKFFQLIEESPTGRKTESENEAIIPNA
ncbi:MAG: hypothetical protein GY870_05080 [archaeon]|nr:hypothetical protein [archaeon]